MNDLQTKLFETVRQRARNPKHWIDEIAEVLCKSKHSIYKKIQGEVCLSFDEVVTLASHYQMYLDPLIRPGRILSFELTDRSDAHPCTGYLSHILAQLQMARALPDIRIWYTGIELPFIHDHLFPDLVAFRFFIHSKTVWADNATTPVRFDINEARKDTKLARLLGEILRLYYQLPTTEIWNQMILDITLSQIKYALQSHMLATPGDALTLCDALDGFVLHAEAMAERGLKFIPGENTGAEIELFHNEIAHAVNAFLLKSSRGDVLYMGFASPHFMYSHSGPATENIDRWLRTLRRNAAPVVRESRKERTAFFSTLQKKIARARVEMDAIIKLDAL